MNYCALIISVRCPGISMKTVSGQSGAIPKSHQHIFEHLVYEKVSSCTYRFQMLHEMPLQKKT